MPIYEYRCDACGHTLDALQKISDAPLKECPECREASLRRLISAPSFRLKGGGWYETDFKSDKERKRNLAETGGEKKDDKKESGDKPKESAGKDAKPEKKSGDASSESKKPAGKSSGSGTEAA